MIIHSGDLPTQKECINAKLGPCHRINEIAIKRRLITALNRQVPGRTDIHIKIRDLVLVCRDDVRRWIDSHKVIKVNYKTLVADFGDRQAQFCLNRWKPYSSGEEVKTLMTGQRNWTEAQLHNNDVNEQENTLTETQEKFWDIPHIKENQLDISLAHILKLDDPRTQDMDFLSARKNKTAVLEARNIWTIVRSEEIPPKLNVVAERFVFRFKNDHAPEETSKLRYVAQWYGESMESLFAH